MLITPFRRFSHDPDNTPVEVLERSKIDPDAFEKRFTRRLLELLYERFVSSVRVDEKVV